MSSPSRARLTSALVLVLGLFGCGRAEVGGLSRLRPGTGSGGRTDAGPARDATVGDSGPMVFDAGLPPRDDAGVPMCRGEGDCYRRLGEPICADGRIGAWACVETPCPASQCPTECVQIGCDGPPPVRCGSDCDCPGGLNCERGLCQPTDRRNLCCSRPDCPPGERCVWPDGEGICPGGPMGCANDCDCPPELACAAGACMPLNRNNVCCAYGQCRPGDACVERDGRPGRCPEAARPGSPCQSDASCSGGFCIDESSGFPGGYCSSDCMGMCRDGVCVDADGSGLCLAGCNAPADCRAGYSCLRLGLNATPVCWPDFPGSMNPRGAVVGAGCRRTEDCAAGLSCLGEDEGGWVGGYCTLPYCDGVTRTCPAASQCYAFPGLFSACLATCPSGGSRSTCRAGYYCLGPVGAPGVCLPN